MESNRQHASDFDEFDVLGAGTRYKLYNLELQHNRWERTRDPWLSNDAPFHPGRETSSAEGSDPRALVKWGRPAASASSSTADPRTGDMHQTALVVAQMASGAIRAGSQPI
jgi:hypothetical protein